MRVTNVCVTGVRMTVSSSPVHTYESVLCNEQGNLAVSVYNMMFYCTGYCSNAFGH